MYKNNSGQYAQNIDRSKEVEKPVMVAPIRMKPNKPTGRRVVVSGTWKKK